MGKTKFCVGKQHNCHGSAFDDRSLLAELGSSRSEKLAGRIGLEASLLLGLGARACSIDRQPFDHFRAFRGIASITVVVDDGWPDINAVELRLIMLPLDR